MPAMVFLMWDYFFTKFHIWGFNDRYIIGWKIFQLPVEEILFFIIMPFACLFIYECLNYYFPTDWLRPLATSISAALTTLLVITAVIHRQKLYTMTSCTAAASALLFAWITKFPHMGKFYRMYLVVCLPFFIVNGTLTYLPVVWYDNNHTLGVRLVSIPLEDTIYLLAMLLWYLIAYERIQIKSKLPMKQTNQR